MVDWFGKVFVSDFGLAQFTNTVRSRKATLIGGTSGYIAPEVRDGKMPTALSDIYALGAILSAILDVGDFDDEMHHCLLKISRRCMSPRPEIRPQSAENFAMELPS